MVYWLAAFPQPVLRKPGNEKNNQACFARAVSGVGAAGGGAGRIRAVPGDIHHRGPYRLDGPGSDWGLSSHCILQTDAEEVFVVQPRVVRIVFCPFRRHAGTRSLHWLLLL